ncbi:hypothetical protein PR048_019288 [Dryococelus australis]|uniref:Uncharacterized protein n=1 Tax=Dryococelus australis TaxID=614101 RepID=A0ABQ9H342_9NEOP|nr:hypothetical protein PR048_019288 [Dryococelus australis]
MQKHWPLVRGEDLSSRLLGDDNWHCGTALSPAWHVHVRARPRGAVYVRVARVKFRRLPLAKSAHPPPPRLVIQTSSVNVKRRDWRSCHQCESEIGPAVSLCSLCYREGLRARAEAFAEFSAGRNKERRKRCAMERDKANGEARRTTKKKKKRTIFAWQNAGVFS